MWCGEWKCLELAKFFIVLEIIFFLTFNENLGDNGSDWAPKIEKAFVWRSVFNQVLIQNAKFMHFNRLNTK